MTPREERVILVTRALRLGGVATFILRLGRRLAREGFRVDIVTTDEPGEWAARARDAGLGFTHVPGSDRLSPIAHARRVGETLASMSPDIVFLNHARPAQITLGMLPESTFVVPVVHNDIEEIYSVAFANAACWNALVAPSPKTFEVARARLPGRPIFHFPHGVEIPPDSLDAARRKKEERPFRIAYIGRFEDRTKGVLLLPEILREAARDADVLLHVAGTGPDEASLLEKIHAMGLGRRFRREGPLAPDAAYDLLRRCHAHVQPSSVEGFSLVTLEAQACGCVPIATLLPGSTDAAIEDGKSGILVPPGDVAGFARAIASLAGDRDRWLALAEEGWRQVRERHDVERMGGAYLHLIEEGLAGRYPRAAGRHAAIDRALLTWRDHLPPPLLETVRRATRGLRGRGRNGPQKPHVGKLAGPGPRP
jgi:glycosyltransferase involved in cell wall biosynthesis